MSTYTLTLPETVRVSAERAMSDGAYDSPEAVLQHVLEAWSDGQQADDEKWTPEYAAYVQEALAHPDANIASDEDPEIMFDRLEARYKALADAEKTRERLPAA